VNLTTGSEFGECYEAALKSTPQGFARTMVSNGNPQPWGGGFAGVGGGYVAGTAVTTWVHEVGHTLNWPHNSVSQPFLDGFGAYSDRLDVMSARVSKASDAPRCPVVLDGVTFYPTCWAQGTSTFNRLSAGWLDVDQVAEHRGGVGVYDLVAADRNGYQLVAVPAENRPGSLITVEARPKRGLDRFNSVGGVAVYFVDQGTSSQPMLGVRRCQVPAKELFPYTEDSEELVGPHLEMPHVLGVGSSLTARGVTIEVLAEDNGGFKVRVSGTYVSDGWPPQCPLEG